MVVVMRTAVMTPMVMRRLRLRSHWGQQKQEQGSEEKRFHILRVPPALIDATTSEVEISKRSHSVNPANSFRFRHRTFIGSNSAQITDLPHPRQTPTIELSLPVI